MSRLTLDDARAIIDRGIEKAASLTLRGSFVVVDEGGHPVSISRMDGAPAAGVGVSRAKAYIAAMTHEPTTGFSGRMHAHPERFAGYQTILREPMFPGPGGMPIRKDGRVVGGFSTGPGIGPARKIAGIDASRLMVDGEPANAEDLVVAHALEIPYTDQHPEPGPAR